MVLGEQIGMVIGAHRLHKQAEAFVVLNGQDFEPSQTGGGLGLRKIQARVKCLNSP